MNIFRASVILRLVCLVLAGGAGVAHAGGGRIQLSGAVVEPTCPVEVAPPTATTQGERRACGASAHSSGRSYARHVVELSPTLAQGDRLLAYYLGNAPTGTAPRVVVQTYD